MTALNGTRLDPLTDALPLVEVGDMVYWYDHGILTSTPRAAVVTSIGLGGQMLNLNLFEPENYNLRIKDGVRHISDPRARTAEFQENGAWDLTPREKRLRKAMTHIEALAS